MRFQSSKEKTHERCRRAREEDRGRAPRRRTPEKVVEGANFIEDLGADSLDTVELVMAFEEEFGVEIPDDAAETIVTVGDAVQFLSSKSA